MNALPAGLAFATLAALCFGTTGLAAQTVYRCGNEYRAEPCPGGRPVKSDDLASPADRLAEGRAVAAREKRLAEEMARDRRAREAAPPRGASSIGPTSPGADPSPQAAATLKPKKKTQAKIRVVEGKDFVAGVPAKGKPR